MKNSWILVALAAVAAVFLLKKAEAKEVPREDTGTSGDWQITIE